MATITLLCSSSNDSAFKSAAKIQLTYTAKNGTLAITEVKGMRSDGNHTYDLTAREIDIKVNNRAKTVSLSKGVDFDSTPTAFGASEVTWDNLPEAKLDIIVEMPSSAAPFSEAQFTGGINMEYDRYTISYDANGGSGAPNNQTKVYGSEIRLSEEIPTKTGYEFVQWVSTNPYMNFQPNDVIGYNGNLNLVAQWSATAWLKNKTITVETLGALHEHNKKAYAANFADGNTILSSYQYGDELPAAGNVGRIFFKRLVD